MKRMVRMTLPGPLAVSEENGAIVRLELRPEPRESAAEATPLLLDAFRQLDEYFSRNRREFDLPLAPVGTPFQREVWEALRRIPYGETATYKEIAAAVGRPAATRAVGMANHCNPIAIVVPCHRVIGADGSLTGYAGGLELKRRLLDLEQGGTLF